MSSGLMEFLLPATRSQSVPAAMNLAINCLCGSSRQGHIISNHPYISPSDAEMDRHGSGVLFVSHMAIEPPEPQKLSELSYYGSEYGTRFFCGTCGCHVFQTSRVSPALASLAQNPGGVQRPAEFFAVATGVIIESPEEKGNARFGKAPVGDTCDGGLGPYLPVAEMKGRARKPETEAPQNSSQNAVPAVCGCGNVRLSIQRPEDFLDKDVELPYSPYPDLMFPYKTTSKDKLENPSDEKWYLRKTGKGLRYLAGTCACKSCRLSAGYEIQTWAFIPRSAIDISVPSKSVTREKSNIPANDETQDDKSYIPLDFEVLGNLPAGQSPLRSYESSRGVLREFCHICGATVFWHSNERPDLIDVSVGLLQAREGARAETLLEWWRDRCSFAEDAGLDRKGWVRDWAEGLIQGLEQGMKGS